MTNDAATITAHNQSITHSRQHMFLADVTRPDSGSLAKATQYSNGGGRWIMVRDKNTGGFKRRLVKNSGNGNAAAGAAHPAAAAPAINTVAAAPSAAGASVACKAGGAAAAAQKCAAASTGAAIDEDDEPLMLSKKARVDPPAAAVAVSAGATPSSQRILEVIKARQVDSIASKHCACDVHRCCLLCLLIQLEQLLLWPNNHQQVYSVHVMYIADVSCACSFNWCCSCCGQTRQRGHKDARAKAVRASICSR